MVFLSAGDVVTTSPGTGYHHETVNVTVKEAIDVLSDAQVFSSDQFYRHRCEKGISVDADNLR